jgi:CRP/FNR family transcriptional activator FtrB
MQPRDIEALSRIELFQALAEPTLRRLAEGGLAQRLPPGSILFEEGDEPEFLHVVLSGRVALVAGQPERKEAVIEIFAAGEVLIAPAVLLNLPYLMSARVTETARVAMIPAEDFRSTMGKEAALSSAMARTLARH